MGWTPPDGIEVPKWKCWYHHLKEASESVARSKSQQIKKFEGSGTEKENCLDTRL